MKITLKLFVSLLAVVFCQSLFAQKDKASHKKNKNIADENTWLWEISGNGLQQASYLYGTIHMMCPEDFVMGDSLLAILNRSQQLVLEVVDADNPANALVMMQSMTMKGKKMKDLYTPEEYAEVQRFFADSIGISVDMFGSFEPMFFIVATYPAMMGCAEIKSYEVELTTLARKQNKEIKQVETIQQQLAFFDTIPYHIQAAELLRIVREYAYEKRVFAQLTDIYKNKQFKESLVFMHANMGNMVEYKDVLLDNRNKAWVPQIKTMAAEKSTLFAFGAAHLGGEKGVINLLRKEGYTVRPVKN